MSWYYEEQLVTSLRMKTKDRDRNRRVPTGFEKTGRRSRALSAAMAGAVNGEF